MRPLTTLLALLALLLPGVMTAQNQTTNKKSVSKADAEYIHPEKQPEFPGGLIELKRHIKEHLEYPVDAEQNYIEGKVVVEFIVTATGDIGDVKVLRSVHPSLDAEAVRICRSLPRFTPGTVNGQPVNVRYALPINFTLDKQMPDISDDCLRRANQGDKDAQYRVGYCYYHGQGVTTDWIVARYYLEKAAQQGHQEAARLLAKSRQYLRGELD